MTDSRLVDFSELLKDIDFSEELRVYTDVFLEEVIGDLQDQIDLIKAELEWRESEKPENVRKKAIKQIIKNGGVRCEDMSCPCNEVEEDE